jgi:hypothetical protein
MYISLNQLQTLIQKYGRAWEKQDPGLLPEIFDKNATYQVTPFEKPLRGLGAIKRYWIKYPQEDQRNIKFKLGQCAVAGETGYAEWQSSFYRVSKKGPRKLRGIIIITLKNKKIRSLREYWVSIEK